jgi:hypothetical protein
MEKITMAEADRLADATFVLNLSIGSIRTTARVKRERVVKMVEGLRERTEPETVEEMAKDAQDDADEVRVSKELLQVEEVRALIQELVATRALIRQNAQPTKAKGQSGESKRRLNGFLKNGLYLYAATKVDWAEARLATAQERIDALLDALEPKWDGIIKADERRLAPLGLFDPRDYPTLASIREATRLRYSWFRFDVPVALASINKAVFDAEKVKAREMWQEMFDTIRLGYATTLQDFTAKLKASLVPGEDGKTRVLKQAGVDNMMAFLRDYRVQDVTGFEELAALVDRAKDAMRGVDAEVLRTEDKAAARVAQTMTEIGDLLVPLVMEQTRRVQLRD